MKKTFFFLTLLSAALPLSAQQQHSDTVVVDHPDKVIVTTAENTMSVEVIGMKDDKDFHYVKSMTLDQQGITVDKESSTNTDFRFPFTKSSDDNNHRYNLEVSLAPTISVGLVSALGNDDIGNNFGKSVEITWHAWWVTLKKKTSLFSFCTGLWFNWKNYRMTGHTRFDKDLNNVVLTSYPEGAEIKFSRVHHMSTQIPLLVRYGLPKAHVRFSAGCLLNFNEHGNLKTRYSLDGKKHKDRDRNVHLNSFTADFVGYVTYDKLGAYVKYSPCNVLDTKYGPKFHGLSTGLTWNF